MHRLRCLFHFPCIPFSQSTDCGGLYEIHELKYMSLNAQRNIFTGEAEDPKIHVCEENLDLGQQS